MTNENIQKNAMQHRYGFQKAKDFSMQVLFTTKTQETWTNAVINKKNTAHNFSNK